MAGKVFEDAMHRLEVAGEVTEAEIAGLSQSMAEEWPTPAIYLPRIKQQIASIFAAGGFPAPGIVVLHRGRFWCEAGRNDRPIGGAAASPGWAFVRRQTEPLTPEREAADLCHVIYGAEHALTEGSPDQIFAHAVILGAAVNRFNLRRLHLKSVTKSEKFAGGRKNAAHRTNLRHVPLREERFARMAELVPRGGVSFAAHQCEKEGLGKWRTVKKQWERHKEKRDT